MDVIKIAMIGVCGVILAGILKQAGSQLYVVLGLAVSVLIIFYITARLSVIISQVEHIRQYVSFGSEYIGIIFRVIGITYVTQFAADMCRDSGNSAIAGQIELFCKVTIAAISMPLVMALFETVTSCLG